MTQPPLPPPDPALHACVAIPARDEQERIGACLRALAGQRGVRSEEYEILLVLDGGTDATAERAHAVANAHPRLRLHLRCEPPRGAGAARRRGMDLACARLHALDRPGGLIATTDADSVVAPDWLAAQLAEVERGAQAIGGRIELAESGAAALAPGVLRRRARQAQLRHERVLGDPERTGSAAEHWQFSGASLGVTAETYARVGGIEPLPALEDEDFERTLRAHGVPIARSLSVRVATSARLSGRAPRGLARDLELADWLERRSYQGSRYDLADVLAAKGGTAVSAVLPAREVASTIGPIVARLIPLRDAGVLDEVLVIDAASSDGTADIAAAHGASVLQESEILPEHGPAQGKGDAMWRGVRAATGDAIVFLDTDTEDFTAGFALGLLGPLLHDPSLSLVKGSFARPFRHGAGLEANGGGRVTELTARPLINLYVPALAGFVQPLAGEIAGRRDLLEAIPFPVGYGVEIAMLIDALRVAGLDALAQVDLGTRQNRHQSLRALSAMAYSVLTAAARRVHGEDGLADHAPGPLALPAGTELEVSQVPVHERPPLASLRRRTLAS